MVSSTIPAAAFARIPCSSSAPYRWETITPFPAEIPSATVRRRKTKLPVVPTAESAFSPVKRPTIIISTVL